MFVGHYGLALAARSAAPGVSLGTLFVATQSMDIVFSVLLLTGTEEVRIHTGAEKPGGVEMEFVLYSHSLPAALVLSLAAGALLWFLTSGPRPHRRRAAVIVASVTASHYVLDIVTRTADLPVLSHEAELGLGVATPIGLVIETALLLVGLWLYLRATTARDRLGTFGVPVLVAGLILFNVYVAASPPPQGALGLAMSQLGAYVFLAVVAFWLDRHREARAVREAPRSVEQ